MELARIGEWRIRQASSKDAAEISRLLGHASLRHIHADWHVPGDWLGSPGFVLCESSNQSDNSGLLGCLAVGADPPPAAWVRVGALSTMRGAERCLSEMVSMTLPWLRQCGVSILGWLPEGLWPERWLTALGMRKVNHIVTYGLEDVRFRDQDWGSTVIKPAAVNDMPRLAQIEEAAFDPLWRHSARSLQLAYRQALSFDMAEVEGRVVGFQYSVAGQDGRSAHLVRLTVLPEAQGHGVGSSLMAAALRGYARRGLSRATLNTQLDNRASHRLYERFGFRRLGDRVPVWAIDI